MGRLSKLLCTLCLGAMAACTEVECPLDSIVVMTCGLYDTTDGTSLTLDDTLTVRAAGTDSILLNRAQGIKSFALPVRQGVTTDTLLLRFSNLAKQYATDTLFLRHTNDPHFEALDCPAAMFHRIETVSWTSHDLSLMPLTIDSVAVVRTTVDYEDIENLRIYLRARAE